MKNLVLNFNSKKIKKLSTLNICWEDNWVNLAEMGKPGLLVPSGFIISTEVCKKFTKIKKIT